eukprot:scaffold1809_cov386-Prasinococcus_capsulatus_cf.AAC.19
MAAPPPPAWGLLGLNQPAWPRPGRVYTNSTLTRYYAPVPRSIFRVRGARRPRSTTTEEARARKVVSSRSSSPCKYS